MRLKTVGLIVTLALGLLFAPLPAEAQQAGKVARIGFLYTGARPVSRSFQQFHQGLRERGYIERENLIIEWRFAEGKPDRLPGLAAELVRLNVDAIVSFSTTATLAAKRATTSIPIVFGMVSDPIANDIVTDLARPGGNITGVTNILPELSGKLLEFLREAVPDVSRVAVLWNPNNPGKHHEWRETEAAAQVLRVSLHSLEVRTPQDVEAALTVMTRARPDAFITFADPLTYRLRQKIADFAARNRLPAIYQLKWYVEAGGLMSYGLSMEEHSHRLGVLVGKILSGIKPADLPVERPMRFELVINLKTAEALGLTIPQTLLILTTEVIE